MRILGISDIYYPRTSEVSLSIRTLMRELQAKGHAMTLVVPDYPDAADAPGEDLIRVSAWSLAAGKYDRAMKAHRVLELTERLRAWRYDAVHIHTPYFAHAMGVLLARRLRIPAVETWSVFYEELLSRHAARLRPSWRYAMARGLSRVQSLGITSLMVHAAEVRDRLRKYGIEKPISVVSPGLESHVFQSGDGAGFRAAHGIDPERPVLLCVREHASTTSMSFVLDVLQDIRFDLPDVLLLVVGDRETEAGWLSGADRRGLKERVAFLGPLERATALMDCYNAADCFIAAEDAESRDVAMLEAMAAGLPVVATPSMRTKDVIADEGPAIVVPANVSDVAARVLAVLSDSAMRAQLAQAGRQYAQRASASVTVEQVLDCYQEAIDSHRRTARTDSAVLPRSKERIPS